MNSAVEMRRPRYAWTVSAESTVDPIAEDNRPQTVLRRPPFYWSGVSSGRPAARCWGRTGSSR